MIVDLFAGPGGWSEGLRSLGLADVGFEWDAAACATRAAAGHLTVRADVADYPTEPLRSRVEGLIASPPCQAFSVAGKQQGRPTAFLAALEGRYDAEAVRADIAGQLVVREAWELDKAKLSDEHPEWWEERTIDLGGELVVEEYLTDEGRAAVVALIGPPPEVEDERGMFMAEVVRWADDLRPEWIACEQVPPGLGMWQLFARWLGERGYSTWCGVLNAADYGVPQTRRRAILMASRVRRVAPPAPTHCDQRHSPSLFLAPWVSMAEALGWDGAVLRHSFGESSAESWTPHLVESERPAPTVDTKARGWTVETRGDRQTPGGNEFDADAPSWALTEKARSWKVRSNQRTSSTGDYYERDADRPSPTLTEHTRTWKAWPHLAPATTVAGDPRITARCHHDDGSQGAEARTTEQVREGDYDGTQPIRLTVEEALVLQSFPADYPVQGSRTAKFRQVGDAVPPRLAAAIVEALLGGHRRPAA